MTVNGKVREWQKEDRMEIEETRMKQRRDRGKRKRS